MTDRWSDSSFPRVCSHARARFAAKKALHAVKEMTRDSGLFVNEAGADPAGAENRDVYGAIAVPAIEPSDVWIGRLLGRGGFSHVHAARMTVISLRAEEHEAAMTKGYYRQQWYAVKYLSRSAMSDEKRYNPGAADLATEAKMLSALDHPNIIGLRGVTAGRLEESIAEGREGGFFLLLDLLNETLDDRIAVWSDQMAKYSSRVYRTVHDRRGCKRRALLVERLREVRGLADAMKYLHGHSVVYRDIKPENVGYDTVGVLKLFDFGLAKEAKPCLQQGEDAYHLTGKTGSTKYMAPEVAKGLPYGMSADVYSFGILLWEICALEKPFAGYSEALQKDLVVEGGRRPEIDARGAHTYWPTKVGELIKMCWADNPRDRPNFVTIAETLKSSFDEDDGHRPRP